MADSRALFILFCTGAPNCFQQATRLKGRLEIKTRERLLPGRADERRVIPWMAGARRAARRARCSGGEYRHGVRQRAGLANTVSIEFPVGHGSIARGSHAAVSAA